MPPPVPPPRALQSSSKFVLLGALYLSQGLPYGFFVQALPVLLRHQGVSLPAIGLVNLLALPWALKFLWAPGVDAALSKRRVILAMQALTAALIGAVAWLNPAESMAWLLGAVLLVNLLSATQDVATDALAVTLLSRSERGLGNGLQVAAYRVGMILGGGALLWAFDRLGWGVTFALLAGLILLASAPIARYREAHQDHRAPHQTKRSTAFEGFSLRPIALFLKRPGVPSWLIVLFAYKFGEAIAGGMLRPYLIDRGLGLDEIGALLGVAGFTAGLLGAALGGALTTRIGRERALFGFGALQILGQGAYAALALGPGNNDLALWGAVLFEHFTGGLATAALFTMMMDRCRQQSAGTDYTVMASAVVLTVGAGQVASGFIAEAAGYGGVFLIAALIAALGLVAIAALRARWRRAEVAEEQKEELASELVTT